MIRLRAQDLIEPQLEAHFHHHQKLKYWTTVHDHDFYECFLIVSGSVYHIVNGERQLLDKGALVFIRPRDVHSYERFGESEVELLNINFRVKTVEAAFAYLGDDFRPERLLTPRLPAAARLSSTDLARFLEKYRSIAAIPASFGEERRMSARMLLVYTLNEHFGPDYGIIGNSDTPSWLEELQLHMRKKENAASGLDALYRLANMSPEHLSRTVRKHLGITPTEWINDIRLEHAVYAIRHSNIEIVEVAMECGFNNLGHFYKLFKKRHGMSPGKYRSLHRRTAIPQ